MRRYTGAGTIASLLLTCVFAVTLLMALVTGAGVYRRVTEQAERSSERRLGLTYITAKVLSFDEAGRVEAGSFGGSGAVYLYEDFDGLGYETILYVHDGWLMELFCEKEWELDPGDGERIAQAERLEVSQDGNLLRLGYTGASGQYDSALLSLRSAGEEG